MNQPPYLDSQPAHMSAGQSYSPQHQTASGLQQYSQYNQQAGYSQQSPSYGGYYSGSVSSPPSVTQQVTSSMATQLAPLPASLSMGQSHAQQFSSGSSSGSGQSQNYQSASFDSTGQVAPHGVKPRVTATLWEDEGSLCFQVEAKGVCVARREDNHFINGTKLLNVAGMTRGRRDGILKSEKTRHVVKIGPMHLKGVWIPFDRALDFANREKITELLYPLFVHNIGALLYHPTNSNRTNMVMEAAKKRGLPESQSAKLNNLIANPPPSLHHHHSIAGQMSGHLPSQNAQSPHSLPPQTGTTRPSLDRAHTFPTPPTSASSIIGAQGSSYEWSSQAIGGGVHAAQSLAIDTHLSNARSMPSTPATTPPGNTLQNLQNYGSQQSYENSSRSMYSAASQGQSQYTTQQQNLARFGGSMPPGAYLKSEMGPPSQSTRVVESEQPEVKQDPYAYSQAGDSVGHGAADEEAEHEQDSEYARGTHSFGGALHGDQVNGSPHQSGSGRVTPRASVSAPGWSTGYNTPPRTATTNSHFTHDRSSDGYGSSYAAGGAVNGTSTSITLKRSREEDDIVDFKGHGIGAEDLDALKRRKSVREGSMPNLPSTVSGSTAPFDHEGRPISRARSTIIQMSRR